MEQEYIGRVTPLVDHFMNLMFEDKGCVEEAINSCCNEETELKVVEYENQKKLTHPNGKEVVLDVYAKDEKGSLYNIEVQRETKRGADPKRIRYHFSMMDVNNLKKGEDVRALPKEVVIFITENDYFKKGQARYIINRVVDKSGELFKDEQTAIYINCAYRGKGEEGSENERLLSFIHDMTCSRAEDMKLPAMRRRMSYLSNTEEGRKEMNRSTREFLEPFLKEAEAKAAAQAEAKVKEAEAKTDEKKTIDFIKTMYFEGEDEAKIKRYTRCTDEQYSKAITLAEESVKYSV